MYREREKRKKKMKEKNRNKKRREKRERNQNCQSAVGRVVVLVAQSTCEFSLGFCIASPDLNPGGTDCRIKYRFRFGTRTRSYHERLPRQTNKQTNRSPHAERGLLVRPSGKSCAKKQNPPPRSFNQRRIIRALRYSRIKERKKDAREAHPLILPCVKT